MFKIEILTLHMSHNKLSFVNSKRRHLYYKVKRPMVQLKLIEEKLLIQIKHNKISPKIMTILRQLEDTLLGVYNFRVHDNSYDVP